jgi:hypothetical protein
VPSGSIDHSCPQTRSRKNRSWLAATSVPGHVSGYPSSTAGVSMSRSLVGSSSSSRFGTVASTRTNSSRRRSAPDSSAGRAASGDLDLRLAVGRRRRQQRLPTLDACPRLARARGRAALEPVELGPQASLAPPCTRRRLLHPFAAVGQMVGVRTCSVTTLLPDAVLEPLDRVDVEVVGRLVEDQQGDRVTGACRDVGVHKS